MNCFNVIIELIILSSTSIHKEILNWIPVFEIEDYKKILENNSL